uniref:Multivesicular body subunit 12A n=1 Tax=Anser cygnoides TaxID=8845 RepID=A0A8B9II31_ANSCY
MARCGLLRAVVPENFLAEKETQKPAPSDAAGSARRYRLFFFSRQLEECKANPGHAEPPNYLETSQARVLSSKPNYREILEAQGEVLKCVELAVSCALPRAAPRAPSRPSSLSPAAFCSSTNCGRRWSCCGLSVRTATSTCGDCRSTWVSADPPGTVTGTVTAQLGADGLSVPLSSSDTDLPAPGGLAGSQAPRCPAEAGAAGGLREPGPGAGRGALNKHDSLPPSASVAAHWSLCASLKAPPPIASAPRSVSANSRAVKRGGGGASLQRGSGGGYGGGGGAAGPAHRRGLGRDARGGPRGVERAHHQRGGRRGQPGQGLRPQGRRVPVREHRRAGAGVSRKKRVYVRLQPLSAADTAVFDIKLSSKSKAIPHYMKIGELGGFAVWCKKGPVPKSSLAPVPSPRTVSLGLKQLSLQPAADAEQKAPERPLARSGTKRASFTLHNSADDGSGIYNLSAMDGVPFTLHPKFESSLSFGSNALLAELNVKSLADIEKEYNYAFVVERTAAARLPPSIC